MAACLRGQHCSKHGASHPRHQPAQAANAPAHLCSSACPLGLQGVHCCAHRGSTQSRAPPVQQVCQQHPAQQHDTTFVQLEEGLLQYKGSSNGCHPNASEHTSVPFQAVPSRCSMPSMAEATPPSRPSANPATALTASLGSVRSTPDTLPQTGRALLQCGMHDAQTNMKESVMTGCGEIHNPQTHTTHADEQAALPNSIPLGGNNQPSIHLRSAASRRKTRSPTTCKNPTEPSPLVQVDDAL